MLQKATKASILFSKKLTDADALNFFVFEMK